MSDVHDVLYPENGKIRIRSGTLRLTEDVRHQKYKIKKKTSKTFVQKDLKNLPVDLNLTKNLIRKTAQKYLQSTKVQQKTRSQDQLLRVVYHLQGQIIKWIKGVIFLLLQIASCIPPYNYEKLHIIKRKTKTLSFSFDIFPFLCLTLKLVYEHLQCLITQ